MYRILWSLNLSKVPISDCVSLIFSFLIISFFLLPIRRFQKLPSLQAEEFLLRDRYQLSATWYHSPYKPLISSLPFRCLPCCPSAGQWGEESNSAEIPKPWASHKSEASHGNPKYFTTSNPKNKSLSPKPKVLFRWWMQPVGTDVLRWRRPETKHNKEVGGKNGKHFGISKISNKTHEEFFRNREQLAFSAYSSTRGPSARTVFETTLRKNGYNSKLSSLTISLFQLSPNRFPSATTEPFTTFPNKNSFLLKESHPRSTECFSDVLALRFNYFISFQSDQMNVLYHVSISFQKKRKFPTAPHVSRPQKVVIWACSRRTQRVIHRHFLMSHPMNKPTIVSIFPNFSSCLSGDE